MLPNNNILKITFLLFFSSSLHAQQSTDLELSNERLKITWIKTSSGWQIKTLAIKKENNWINQENPSGENTILYTIQKPKTQPDSIFKMITGINFPDSLYQKQLKWKWDDATNEVALNTAGKAYHFFPKDAKKRETQYFLAMKRRLEP